MTVKELIDKLKEFDENKDIFIEDSYYGELAVTTIKNDDNDVVITTVATDIFNILFTMNYITYKQIDGTITSGFKVKLYDIVTLNTGYWKDKLAIVLYINEDKKQIKVRIIECGMNLTLKVKDVQFVNHNNRTAARSYIDLCNKLSKAFRDKYTDKHYIKDNWFTDKFIINDITADTIAKGIGQYITNTDSDRYSVSAIMWLSDIKDYIDALLKYGDFDFVAKAFKIYNITDTRFELIRKLYHYFYD